MLFRCQQNECLKNLMGCMSLLITFMFKLKDNNIISCINNHEYMLVRLEYVKQLTKLNDTGSNIILDKMMMLLCTCM